MRRITMSLGHRNTSGTSPFPPHPFPFIIPLATMALNPAMEHPMADKTAAPPAPPADEKIEAPTAATDTAADFSSTGRSTDVPLEQRITPVDRQAASLG